MSRLLSIIQITGTPDDIFGLGNDGMVYIWDWSVGGWRLYKKKD